MTFVIKTISRMTASVRFCKMAALPVFSLLVFLALLPVVAYAQSMLDGNPDAITVAAKAKYSWEKSTFEIREEKRKKARRKVRRKKAVKKKAKKTPKKLSKKQLRKKRLLKRKLYLLSKKRKKRDRCGYPWVYAYKYKRCICERRGFTQLGNRCVRLSRHCAGGSVWSAVTRKCLCKTGFEYRNKQCVNVALLDDDDDSDDEKPPQLSGESCNAPPVLASLSNTVGECPDGYNVINGKCQLAKAGTGPVAGRIANLPAAGQEISSQADRAPAVVSAVPVVASLDEPVYDLVQIRSCLFRAGFRGRAAAGQKYSTYMATYDAFKKFRKKHGLGHKAMDIYDLDSQKILFGLCQDRAFPKSDDRQAGRGQQGLVVAGHRPARRGRPSGSGRNDTGYRMDPPAASGTAVYNRQPDGSARISSGRYAPVTVTGATRNSVTFPQKQAACLPSDLYDFLTTSYGTRPGLKKCARACIPAPATMSVTDRQAYSEKYDISWCKKCLNVTSYMPLDDVLKVEKRARVQVCTNPATSLLFSRDEPRLIGRSYPRARGLYRDLPESASNVNTIAVLIGNRDYRGDFGINSNALNDAGAMFSLLSEHLGYAPENIFDLRNASLKQMESVLGSAQSARGKLWEKLQRHPESRVMIYYSGHAINNGGNGKNYLLPVDAVPGRETRTGYSISLLLKNLRKLRAPSIMLVLETEFGRKTGNAILPPNASELTVQLQSSVPVPGLTIFMASHGNQKALEDPDYGIGLFTRYFIAGLAGSADRRPVGNADGRIDVVELYVYAANMVRLSARKSFGLLQNPTLGQTGNLVISRLKR